MPQAPLISRPGIEALWRFAHGPLQLGIGNGRGDGDRYRFGNLVLHREDIGEIAVVALGPDVVASLRFDQLGGHTDPIAGLTHTAFEHIAHAEFAPDLFHIDRPALVGEARVPRDDEQRGIARQRGDNVLGDPVGDELLIRVAARAGWVVLIGSPRTLRVRTRYTRNGRAMFLTRCSPASSKAKSSLSRTWSRTTRLTQIPPGSAKASSRAATLTPSP